MEPRWVVITGASAGLGVDFARLFAADGHPLVLVARRRERLDALAESLPTETRVLVQDLAQPQAAARVTAHLEQEGIEPYAVVNNAGFGMRGKFVELDRERQLEMIQLNVTVLTDLTRRLLPGMIARGAGGMLNVASLAAFQPGPNMSVYYATKAFVLHLTEGIAQETRGLGVTVTAFCPGPVATEFGEVSGLGKPAAFNWWTMSSARAARIGYRGFLRGRTVIVPGVIPQLARFLNWITPRSWSRAVMEKIQ
jgi:hypothetical protein